MRLTILLLLIFVSTGIFAQRDSSRVVIQFSGLVVTGDSLTPVPFTTVYRERDQRGTITDNLGFFSVPAFAGDTINFSCIGYLPSTYVIPDSLTGSRYNLVQVMGRDTVQLETTFVYPWPTKERFRQDFLALDLPGSRDDLAAANLEAAKMYERMIETGMDGAENYRYAVSQEARKIQYAGSMPTISLMNPIAWAQFIQAWRSGKLGRQ